MAKAVYGIYTNRAHAEEAVEALRAAGFRADDLSVLLPENVGSKDFGYEKHTKAPEHAAPLAAREWPGYVRHGEKPLRQRRQLAELRGL